MLKEQLLFHTPYGHEKNISISLDSPEQLPHIFANQQNIDEVLSNLITNAIKYSPEGSSISISAMPENEYLKIIVGDTGYGMEKEDLEKIFTRFYRVKDTNTRAIQGTGLGLSLVKTIIDSHHGKITVESEPGQGTTFTVLLPIAKT
jgi:two-component system phosphate regulon sensor histidine kinase PhoR